MDLEQTKNQVDLPDPVELVQQAIDADLDSSVFTERQFDTAPNVIEWCLGHQYLGATSIKPWPRQIQVLSRFFEDVCYFCSDPDYVHNVGVDDPIDECLDRFTLLQYGVCPKCKRNRTEMLDDWLKDPRYPAYHKWDEAVNLRAVPPNEFIGIWGQRCGKSFLTSTFIWTYVLHRYLAIPNLTRYFRMPSNVVLEAAFVAPTKKQINDTMWQPFYNAYDGSPWFKEMVQHLSDEGKRIGIPTYHRLTESLAFPIKRLAIYMKAANTSNLRGGTRIWASLDELGWFNVSEDGRKRSAVKDGVEVFTSLNRSLRTVRSKANKRRRQLGDYNALDGYMCCVSSPSSVNDPIEQRGQIANKTFRMYFSRYATWEVNPDEDEETIRDEEGADPIKLKRDYCALPPRAAAPFIEPGPRIMELVDKAQTNKHLFDYDIQIASDPEAGIQLLRPILTAKNIDRITPRALCVDNGEKKNSFALAMARYYPEHDGVLLEEFLEVHPYSGHIVDLAWCYDELIVPLVRAFNVVHVIYDQWESAYAIRDLRTTHGIDARQYSLKWGDFEAYRNAIKDSRLYFPEPEIDPDVLIQNNNTRERAKYPRANFQIQLTTVNEFGRKVAKPDHGEDDLFRCSVLCHWCIQSNKEIYAKGTRRRGRMGGGGSGRGSMFFGRSRRSSGRGRGGSFGGGRRGGFSRR